MISYFRKYTTGLCCIICHASYNYCTRVQLLYCILSTVVDKTGYLATRPNCTKVLLYESTFVVFYAYLSIRYCTCSTEVTYTAAARTLSGHLRSHDMCPGVLVLVGPPSLLGGCVATWYLGHALASSSDSSLATYDVDAPSSSLGRLAGAGAMGGVWAIARRTLFPIVDAGGALSAATATLGEPLKIASWRDFYRATGPPVAMRCAVGLGAFAVGGATAAVVTDRTRRTKRESSGRRL